MKTLVVTGGIGSGKSTVCRFFASKGVPVYDSDSRTRLLYDTEPGLPGKIEDSIGCKVTDSSGRIDRRRLAEVIFSDADKLAVLESVVHPAVKADFIRWRDSADTEVPFVIMESAIILEKPLFRNLADKVLLVDAPLDVRLRRACLRDGVTEAAVMKRMQGQKLLNDISEGRVSAPVDYVIMNDSGQAALKWKVDAVYMAMCE